MFDEIYNILKPYLDQKEYVDENYARKVLDIVKENENLQEYVIDYDFNKIKDKRFHAGYDEDTKIIHMDLDKIHVKDDYLRHPDTHYFMYNFDVSKCIFHELAHAELHKLYYEAYEKHDYVLLSLFYLSDADIYVRSKLLNKIIINIKNRYYNANWAINPLERIADIKSELKVRELLDKTNEEDDIVGYTKELSDIVISNTYLKGYRLINNETNSPSIEYLERVPFSNNRKKLQNDLTLFNPDIPYEDRLLYGLFLTKDEYNNLNKEHDQAMHKLLEKVKH